VRSYAVDGVEEAGEGNPLFLAWIVTVVLIVDALDSPCEFFHEFFGAGVRSRAGTAALLAFRARTDIDVGDVVVAAHETGAVDVLEEDDTAAGEAVEEHTEVFFGEGRFEEGYAVYFETEDAGYGEGEGRLSCSWFAVE